MRSLALMSLVSLGMLTACGGGGNGGGGGSVVTPAPTPTPAPSPSPSPSPTPTYARFVELTGNQNFRTACGALDLNAAPPAPQPATDFGNGFDLSYTAGSENYLLTGDGQSLSYGPAQRDPASPSPTGSVSYTRVADGFTQRLTLGIPTTGGVALDYTRGLSLRALRLGRPAQYQCIYGVPTLATDLPAASVVYARTSLIGTIYAATTGGAQQVYSTEASVVGFTLDPVTSRVTFTLRLLGTLQTASGPATTTTDLGTYTGTGTINAARTSYSGTLTSADRTVQFGTFGGWVFGPQAREAGLTLTLLALEPVSGTRVSVLGNIVATR
ncbi:MAG: hypothetical protein V4537_00115 [Pseudomonadota bacterium]